ncbi:MAG: DUF1934 domain-containing protein [Lachnospiraceae bacterium]|jgi:uncharacterized beta-barrel protein YwiB (DUF1934 family)|nr:DUF1934 domain-containing protein [Lachnospiraceae bacterium]
MDKDVFVRLKGLQIDERDESAEIEIVAPGFYCERGGKKMVVYEEVVEGMEKKIKNVIKITPEYLEVTKRGLTNTHMMFELDKKNVSVYSTPFGEMTVGILAKDIALTEADHSLSVKVEYELDMNYEHLADCTINIGVESRSRSDFRLTQ